MLAKVKKALEVAALKDGAQGTEEVSVRFNRNEVAEEYLPDRWHADEVGDKIYITCAAQDIEERSPAAKLADLIEEHQDEIEAVALQAYKNAMCSVHNGYSYIVAIDSADGEVKEFFHSANTFWSPNSTWETVYSVKVFDPTDCIDDSFEDFLKSEKGMTESQIEEYIGDKFPEDTDFYDEYFELACDCVLAEAESVIREEIEDRAERIREGKNW